MYFMCWASRNPLCNLSDESESKMDEPEVLRMFGITCPTCGKAARLGKLWLPPNAQISDLRATLRALGGLVDHDVCPVCFVVNQVSLDDIKFVDDSEPPPELSVTPS